MTRTYVNLCDSSKPNLIRNEKYETSSLLHRIAVNAAIINGRLFFGITPSRAFKLTRYEHYYYSCMGFAAAELKYIKYLEEGFVYCVYEERFNDHLRHEEIRRVSLEDLDSIELMPSHERYLRGELS